VSVTVWLSLSCVTDDFVVDVVVELEVVVPVVVGLEVVVVAFAVH